METTNAIPPGSFVVEVGIRQAWPFVTFYRPDDTEVRLYIDTDVNIAPFMVEWLSQDDDRTWASLAELNGLGVMTVDDRDGDLVIRFSGQVSLRVRGEGNSLTTHEVWWTWPS